MLLAITMLPLHVCVSVTLYLTINPDTPYDQRYFSHMMVMCFIFTIHTCLISIDGETKNYNTATKSVHKNYKPSDKLRNKGR